MLSTTMQKHSNFLHKPTKLHLSSESISSQQPLLPVATAVAPAATSAISTTTAELQSSSTTTSILPFTPPTPPTSPAAVFGRPLDQDTIKRNKEAVHYIKNLLFDQLFAGESRERAFARFYALETIARMPYFSYLSVLHLLETLGKWRRADYLKLHFCQSWNEMHHLLIMESLGGSQRFADRWVAQHVAFTYYWFAVVLYLFNPTWAYNLNEAVEEEAYATYNGFLEQHREWLQTQPAPEVAKAYYRDGELFLFDEMHLDTTRGSTTASTKSSPKTQRRPKCDTLYDVILAIRDDEMEHVKTMKSLQEGA